MDRRIASILFLLQDQPTTDLLTLASSVNLSLSRLRHIFRNETSTSLHKYVTRRRLLLAQKLLTTSFLSVKQVCAASGFRDTGHFIRVFRGAFGMPPAAYRCAASIDRK